jgi:hypothetical protein
MTTARECVNRQVVERPVPLAREVLAGSVAVATGDALVNPLSRWLGLPSTGMNERADGTRRIGMSEVTAIEQATRHFAAIDAEVGGGLSREAAVGQLKYAVDLARYASYSEPVGNRLLTVVAVAARRRLDLGVAQVGEAELLRFHYNGRQPVRQALARAPLGLVLVEASAPLR